MNETTFRILDVLARRLGHPLSIRELVAVVRDLHGTAHYANVYRALRPLRGEGVVLAQPAGRSSQISLDLRSTRTVDLLAETELERKRRLLAQRPEAGRLMEALSDAFGDLETVGSVSLVDPERGLRLNRVELLVTWVGGRPEGDVRAPILEAGQRVGRVSLVRIDTLALEREEFLALLGAEEANPVRDAMARGMAVLGPQALWLLIRALARRGIQVRWEGGPVDPADVPEAELVSNLARFGYQELGTRVEPARTLCLEYVVVALLLGSDPRRRGGAAVLLAKNRFHPHLLAYLAIKHGVAGPLLGILRMLSRIRPADILREAVKELEAEGEEGTLRDEERVREALRTYDALG